MKRTYSKPVIYVEDLQLDSPIASNCDANKADMESLLELRVFTKEMDCFFPILETGELDEWGYPTVCYHTNIDVAFLS